MTARSCYFAAEMAHLLGISIDTFDHRREELHRRGMPLSRTLGRVRIPRAEFDHWLAGRGAAIAAAAINDSATRDLISAARVTLAREYRREPATSPLSHDRT